MLDLIEQLHCEVIVVASNKLGVINHAVLTGRALRGINVERLKVVLMDCSSRDPSADSNQQTLIELLARTPIFSIPYLGDGRSNAEALKKHAGALERTLSEILTDSNPAANK